ncbi:unnamed protein product [Spodoptera exigua]|nr:unnamed protein product [Spodoptera exigua]
MHAAFVLVAICLTVVNAVPESVSGIVGGSETVLTRYPSIASLLYSSDGNNFNQVCVGTIINLKSIVTAAHCIFGDTAEKWRARVGSSWANSGGFVYALNSFTIHPNYNIQTMNNDIAILHPTVDIAFTIGNVVKPVFIAGSKYNLPVSQIVWAAGWGSSHVGAAPSEKLRHFQGRVISHYTCAAKYATIGANLTDNMLCFGWPYGVSRDRCQGDSGSPVYHNAILVGISSWGYDCASGYHGVNTRISKLATWILENSPVF